MIPYTSGMSDLNTPQDQSEGLGIIWEGGVLSQVSSWAYRWVYIRKLGWYRTLLGCQIWTLHKISLRVWVLSGRGVFSVKFHHEHTDKFISGGWDDTVPFWDVRSEHSTRSVRGFGVLSEIYLIERMDVPSTHLYMSVSAAYYLKIAKGEATSCQWKQKNCSDIVSMHSQGRSYVMPVKTRVNKHFDSAEINFRGLICDVISSQFCKSSYLWPPCWFPLYMARYWKIQQIVPLLFI